MLYLPITKLLLRATGNHDQAQVCQTSVLLGRLCWHASVITGQAFPASAYRKDAHRCVKASHTLQSVQQYSSAQDLVLINQLTVITLCTALLSLCLSRVTVLPYHDYEWPCLCHWARQQSNRRQTHCLTICTAPLSCLLKPTAFGTVLKWDTLCIQIVSQLCSHDATICIQAFDKCVRLTYALLQSTTNVHLHIATEKWHVLNVCCRSILEKQKRKDYTFRRQLNEKPNIIPGCPGSVKQVLKMSL